MQRSSKASNSINPVADDTKYYKSLVGDDINALHSAAEIYLS